MSGGLRALTRPIVDENPITLQILGICSALAVTRRLDTALLMGVSVIGVLGLSNAAIASIRHGMPRSIRLIVICTVVDQLLRAFGWELSRQLSIFVGLIITNCIVLGRAEGFAMSHGVRESFVDGVGNGIGYALARVGVGALALRDEPPALRKARADLALDLSAVAKGFAVDALALRLEERGIERFLAEVGGELRARGEGPGGGPWRVGIERPAPGRSRVAWELGLADAALATSGDYRHYLEAHGRRLAHVIDPRTGRPAWTCSAPRRSSSTRASREPPSSTSTATSSAC
jgi:Na+-translocating ferredoxin:NAD+ oxidoreductase RnfA subunit